jgi:hypothetical protein
VQTLDALHAMKRKDIILLETLAVIQIISSSQTKQMMDVIHAIAESTDVFCVQFHPQL